MNPTHRSPPPASHPSAAPHAPPAVHQRAEPIRVCHIIPTLDEGGAEKQLCLLTVGLDRRQFSPSVITLTRHGPRLRELQAAGVPVFSVNKRGKLDPTALWRLRQQIQRLQPTIVHTWLYAANSYGRVAARLAGVPIIIAAERCVDPWKGLSHRLVDSLLAGWSQAMVTNSPAVRDFYANRGIAAGRFEVIPNGIPETPNDQLNRYDRQTALRQMGLDPSWRVIGSIGRLWPQKGYKELIWGAELLRVGRPDVCYVILGDGPQRARLEWYRDQIRASSRLFFLGHRHDVSRLLPHFDLFWNGSHYEGQSNSILEAMAAGVPVIASDIPGNRDLIEHQKTGLLFRLGDSAQLAQITSELLNQPERCRRLAAAAQERLVTHFSVATMVDRYQRFYRRLLREQGL
jgi:glycosyltransferase involved in cell wall biosynthesis